MSEFKAWCSPLTKRIYAGKINDKNICTGTKHDITDTVTGAVAEHLLYLDASIVFDYKGESYKMQLSKNPKK